MELIYYCKTSRDDHYVAKRLSVTLQLSQQLDVLLEMLCDKLEADTVEQTEKVLQSLQQKLYDIGECGYESTATSLQQKLYDIGECGYESTVDQSRTSSMYTRLRIHYLNPFVLSYVYIRTKSQTPLRLLYVYIRTRTLRSKYGALPASKRHFTVSPHEVFT